MPLTKPIKIAKPGAAIVFSLRDDPEQLPDYPARVQALTDQGLWSEVWSSPSPHSMPYGAPTVTHRIHVYRKA